ncbi:hypothetical protein NQ317_016848 [Molorchus minor]|uniref:Uncharacterized protein n=1 Tax=Molorchus minor TaxID=1323400 RepID=A0ABQ9JJS3_9CUCU|nr:hypothetical protein NQ317_016848 [Molorchus minor]
MKKQHHHSEDKNEEQKDHVDVNQESSDTEQEFEDAEEDSVESIDPHFIGKDKKTIWKKHYAPSNFKIRTMNIIKVKLPSVSPGKKLEFKIEAFLGLLLLAGVEKCNHLNAEDLFKTNGAAPDIFRTAFSLQSDFPDGKTLVAQSVGFTEKSFCDTFLRFQTINVENPAPDQHRARLQVSVTLLNHYFDTRAEQVGCIQNVLILQGIISKLKGRAKEVVSIYGCNDWEQIKETLIQNFGDQRDENSLTRDLVNLRQLPHDTPMQFYEKVMGLLSIVNNYIELHNTNASIIASKRNFFKQQALTTFLAGLRELIGSTIRAMRPKSLADAIQYIQEELNIRYLQGSHMRSQDTPPRRPEIPKPQLQQNSASRFYQPNFAPKFHQSNPAPRFYQPNFTQQPRFNHFQNHNQPRFPQGPI